MQSASGGRTLLAGFLKITDCAHITVLALALIFLQNTKKAPEGAFHQLKEK